MTPLLLTNSLMMLSSHILSVAWNRKKFNGMLSRSRWALIAAVLTPLPAAGACNIINGKAYGDCEGVNVNVGVGARLSVNNYHVATGIFNGATVEENGVLIIRGISTGNVDVQEGGRSVVGGMVNGILSVAGSAEIEGMVDHLDLQGGHAVIGGTVGQISGVGRASFKEGSVLGGQPFNADTMITGK